MAVTFADVLTWEPGPLGSAADSLARGRRRLLDLEGDVDRAHVPWALTWKGQAADRARGSIGRLADRGEHLVAQASTVEQALSTAADRVTALKGAVQDLSLIHI